ncbi:fumarylacetoacetate hydrolase family protein [Dactylosporangium siamense]|uniref:Fumarylacetoacetate hydrolase n=2 Tax=Dactylosporangium siamense TaxID=685454 RepID=A0A919PRT0_9ACTN|nr:fumarylacetoacetate hydrolase [Dactylosporangium siamense]
MRLANVAGRLVSQEGADLVDVATASDGRFGPDPHSALDRWDEFTAWSFSRPAAGAMLPAPVDAGPPVPRPSQVFGIGLNYADHAGESGMALPSQPMVFPKFSSCITGPGAVALPSDTVDWEVELVVVIGRTARHVDSADAWAHVAGLTVGQDLSDRALQFAGGASSQFGLGKSLPGFGPIGPWLVTPDELTDPSNLEISCQLNGARMQHSHTKHLIFTVPALIAFLSSHLPLHPGDLIFTGTPAGVGHGRDPAVYLRPGDELVSTIEGLGSLTTRIGSAS